MDSAGHSSEDIKMSGGSPGRGWWPIGARAPFAALLAIATIITIEIMCHSMREFYYDAYTIMLDDKRQTAESTAADVVILGNSRGHHIDPEQVSAALPGRPVVRNYTWAWCGVEIYDAMLRALVAMDHKPSTIIVDGLPELFRYPDITLTVENNLNSLGAYVQVVPPVPGIYTLARHHLYPAAWKAFTIYITPPTTRYRRFLIPNTLKLLTDEEGWPYPPPLYEATVEHSREHGWFLCVPPERVATHQQFTDLLKAVAPLTTSPDRRILKSYERFIRNAKKQGVRVLMVALPTNPVVYKDFTESGAFASYDKWLDKMERRHENFKAPGPRYYTGENILGDPWHVNQAGAIEHMKLLTETLRKLSADNQTTAAVNPPAS